jgi:photosynthetic reaction center H subunit
MSYGAVLERFDVAQIAIYLFWGFFAALIWFLRREDHREGYPLVADYPAREQLATPPLPAPKEFIMAHGEVVLAPRVEEPEVFAAERVQPWPGAPYEPTGNPMIDGVGPAAYANRADLPDHAYDDGLPKIVPLRASADFYLAHEDTDPRGFTVFGSDGRVAGKVVDVWIDRSEYIVRYLEVERIETLGGGTVLLPAGYAKLKNSAKTVKVDSILTKQFATVPALRNPDVVTLREEDRISAYYAGGYMYATASRLEPVL